MTPTTGLVRALDLGLPEYQGGQDFTGVWNASTGQYHPGFPATQADLSFLSGPSAGDVDSVPGDEVLAATASLDLNAYNAQTGAPADPTKWPKLTSDWAVANPLIGSFGQLETDSATHNRVIELTRAGTLFAYDTPAPACPLGSWPRFHHDNASSGDFSRDAVSPGVPTDATVRGSTLTFTAPGDDLLCGNVRPLRGGHLRRADQGHRLRPGRAAEGHHRRPGRDADPAARLPAAALRGGAGGGRPGQRRPPGLGGPRAAGFGLGRLDGRERRQ